MNPEEFQKLVNLQKLKHRAGILVPKKAKPQPKTATTPSKRPKGKPMALGVAGGPRSKFAQKVASRLRATLADASGCSKHPEQWRLAIADWQRQTARMEARLARSPNVKTYSGGSK